MIASIALLLTSPAATALPPACASTAAPERVAGRWGAEFAGYDWTYELTRSGSGWTGRYQSSKTGRWHPLVGVTVTGGCATFRLPSQPTLTYRLVLNADGSALEGELEIAGIATRPAALRRAS